MSDVRVSTIRANGTAITYAEAGHESKDGVPVVLIHGSLSDYRYWTLQMEALGAHFRVIAPSLRHYYPERWDGVGTDFNIEQHRDDVVALIDALGVGPAHIVGHSRGGHIAFRLAEHFPDRVRRLVLSEPGGALDASLSGTAAAVNDRFSAGGFQAQAEARIRAGDIDGGLEIFLDAVSGAGSWAHTPERAKQFTRDNATTLLGQVHEARAPFARDAAQAIRAETTLMLGALSPPMFGQIVDALVGAIPRAHKVVIAQASHLMNVAQPALFNDAVLRFLRETP